MLFLGKVQQKRFRTQVTACTLLCLVFVDKLLIFRLHSVRNLGNETILEGKIILYYSHVFLFNYIFCHIIIMYTFSFY